MCKQLTLELKKQKVQAYVALLWQYHKEKTLFWKEYWLVIKATSLNTTAIFNRHSAVVYWKELSNQPQKLSWFVVFTVIAFPSYSSYLISNLFGLLKKDLSWLHFPSDHNIKLMISSRSQKSYLQINGMKALINW